MQPLQLISNENIEEQTMLASQLVLDDARTCAMESMLKGQPLDHCLNTITECLETILASCHSQVLLFDNANNCFYSLNQTTEQYPSFINNVTKTLLNNPKSNFRSKIIQGKHAIEPDIFSSKDWQVMHVEAKKLGLVANWILPIISEEGSICGVYIALFNSSNKADVGNLALLQRATQSICALLSHSKNKVIELKQKAAQHQKQLLQEQNTKEINSLLEKAIKQRGEVQSQLLKLENMAALGIMMSSLTHEISSPIGVSVTAASFLGDMQDSCFEKLQDKQLKRSELIVYLKESAEASKIIERNMLRADQLIKTFKRLSVDQHSQDIRSFYLCDYVYEVLLSLKPRLKHTPHKFCIDIPADLAIVSNPGALSQLLINLIMNSAHHAFPLGIEGRITIKASIEYDQARNKKIVLTYQDNGIGMSPQTIENMYKPFFTLLRETENCGLGMHICNNIVMKVLRGTIDCRSELGKGVAFTITFPV